MKQPAVMQPAPTAASEDPEGTLPKGFDFLQRSMTGAEFESYLTNEIRLSPEDLLSSRPAPAKGRAAAGKKVKSKSRSQTGNALKRRSKSRDQDSGEQTL